MEGLELLDAKVSRAVLRGRGVGNSILLPDTDVKDAEWLADLLQHGRLGPSFVPPASQRQARELTRYRTSLIEERCRAVNRLQKILEGANIKLASVASDVMGVSARAMLEALLQGEVDPCVLAQLARGRMRSKRDVLAQALQGYFTAHHRFLIQEQLAHIDSLDETIAHLSAEIAERLRPFEPQLKRLETIPGIKRRLAEVILAEIGADMSRFPSARHLASWAGMCPGNNESAGKRLSGRTRKGSPWLRTALVEAAHAATHSKDCYLAAQYHRLLIRRGGKKATIAVGHTLLAIVYHVLADEKDYEELGGNYFDEWDRQAGKSTAGAALREAGLRGHAHLDRARRLSMLVPSTHQITALIRAGAASAEGPFCSSSCWLPFFMGVSRVAMSRLMLGFTGRRRKRNIACRARTGGCGS